MKKRSRLNYIEATVDRRYIEQQRFLDEIASKRGLVCFRPDYHADDLDCNTVLIYRKKDEEYNREIDKQSILGFNKYPYGLYKQPIFSFENTNANGYGDLSFANLGTIDLRGLNWKERLEGAVDLVLIKREINDYIRNVGGVLELREADEEFNDLNRRLIDAFYRKNGSAFLFSIYPENDGMFREYHPGDKICNFSCDFVIKKVGEELKGMIEEKEPYEKIRDRVMMLGGELLFWI